MSQTLFLNTVVRKKDGVIFSGSTTSVSSFNDKGRFDILPRHTNFVSVIQNQVELRGQDGKLNRIVIDRGIIYVQEDLVEIYLGI